MLLLFARSSLSTMSIFTLDFSWAERNNKVFPRYENCWEGGVRVFCHEVNLKEKVKASFDRGLIWPLTSVATHGISDFVISYEHRLFQWKWKFRRQLRTGFWSVFINCSNLFVVKIRQFCIFRYWSVCPDCKFNTLLVSIFQRLCIAAHSSRSRLI